MKLVCDSCAQPAPGATAFHRRDGLVKVECSECHGRRISPSIPLNVQRTALALWLILLATQTPGILSQLSSP
jgi:hypothetical protein